MQNNMIAKIAITVAVVFGGAGFLVYSSIGHAQHYMMVDELIKDGDLASWEGKELKVHGWVEAGSIVEKVVNQEMHRTFILQKDGKRIRVFSTGPKPDTFKDLSEVVATGHVVKSTEMAELAKSMDVRLDPDMSYVVDSSELMAKCPSKYDGAQINKKNLNSSKFE